MVKSKRDAIWSSNPMDYINYWVDKHKFAYNKAGVWSIGQDDIRTDELKTQIYVDHHTDHAEVAAEIKVEDINLAAAYKRKVPYKKKDLLHAALDMKIADETKRRLNEIRLKLKYDPTADPGLSLIETWVKNITSTDVKLGCGVLAHFIYQVKRKVYNKDVEHHLLPVLMGAGGKGKSKNLERLLEPLSGYTMMLTSASQLTDERSFHAFAENFVATLDEFAKMDKADFNEVKNFITQPYLNSRTLYSNTRSNSKQNITLIATSNYPINEQIFESEGMRRFYEFNVDKSISREVSESIDYLKMWKSVNENEASPILPFLPELAKHEERIRTPEPIELFFEEFHIDPKKPLTFKIAGREGMYKAFIEWTHKAGFDAPWMRREQNIRTKLLNRGIKQVTVQGIRLWCVNEDCLLNPAYVATSTSGLGTDVNIEEIESLPELEAALKKAVGHQNYELAGQIATRIKVLKHKNGVNGMLLDL